MCKKNVVYSVMHMKMNRTHYFKNILTEWSHNYKFARIDESCDLYVYTYTKYHNSVP